MVTAGVDPSADSLTYPPTLVALVEDRLRWFDLLLVNLVPVVLLGVFLLPRSIREQLALDYAAPTLATAFTSHYVHLFIWHLVLNLLGYMLLVSVAYFLALTSGRRQEFFVVFVTFLFAFPPILSGFNLLFIRPGTSVGFSGVLMAFVGYLPAAIYRYAETHLQLPETRNHSSWLFFFGLAFVSVLALPGVYGLALATAGVLAGVLFVLPLLDSIGQQHAFRLQNFVNTAGYAELAGIGVLLFFGYPLVALPANLAVEGGVVNTYIHVLGYSLGYMVVYVERLVTSIY